ncbi:MAG TPA: DinB family protein [Bacillota bacterium]|nr:DinB family protein [Bacillota bacterium]
MPVSADDLTQAFLRHRKVTQQLCDLMPDAQFGFKPWDGAMSFGALAVHLANSADFYMAMAEGKEVTRPDPASQPQTPADIRTYLAKKTDEQAARIGHLGGDLDRKVTARGHEVPLSLLLGQQREHEAHHKGQMLTMLRMRGNRDELFYAVR